MTKNIFYPLLVKTVIIVHLGKFTWHSLNLPLLRSEIWQHSSLTINGKYLPKVWCDTDPRQFLLDPDK